LFQVSASAGIAWSNAPCRYLPEEEQPWPTAANQRPQPATRLPTTRIRSTPARTARSWRRLAPGSQS